MKRFYFLVVFAFCFVFSIVASETSVDGIYYNFDKTNFTAKVTYKGAEDDWMYDYTGEEQYVGILSVPETVVYEGDTYTVIGFDNDALIGSKLLEILVIPATVTEFGTGVFTLCNSLHTIYIDEGNSTFFMYDKVMYKRNPLSLFFVPRAVSGSIEVYSGITTIPSSAFQSCNITEVIIPESVMTIKDGAFNNCIWLDNVVMGSRVSSIERDAFSSCSSLQEIEFPASLQTIGNSAFSSCEYLSKITLNNGLKTIGSYAFSYCSSLSSVTLPSSLNLIDDKAFYFCESLKKVINNSNLDIQIGAETHGYVAYYATEVITGTESGVSFTEKFSTPIFSMKNGEIHFEYVKNSHVSIFTIDGKLIFSRKVDEDSFSLPLSVGQYIVRIDSKGYNVMITK